MERIFETVLALGSRTSDQNFVILAILVLEICTLKMWLFLDPRKNSEKNSEKKIKRLIGNSEIAERIAITNSLSRYVRFCEKNMGNNLSPGGAILSHCAAARLTAPSGQPAARRACPPRPPWPARSPKTKRRITTRQLGDRGQITQHQVEQPRRYRSRTVFLERSPETALTKSLNTERT